MHRFGLRPPPVGGFCAPAHVNRPKQATQQRCPHFVNAELLLHNHLVEYFYFEVYLPNTLLPLAQLYSKLLQAFLQAPWRQKRFQQFFKKTLARQNPCLF